MLLAAAGLLAELTSLILVGSYLGWLMTFGLLVVATIVGVMVLSGRGVTTMREVLGSMARGESPAPALVDGLLLGFAGLLLITPGFASDVVGLGLLLPPVRAGTRARLTARIHAGVAAARDRAGHGPRGDGGIEVIDVSGTESRDPDDPDLRPRRRPQLPS